MRNRRRLVAIAVGLLVAGVASAADPTAERNLPWHRRPYAAVRVIAGGFPDLYGASGSLYLPRPLALEAGMSRGTQGAGSWYARGGGALSLRERRTPVEVNKELARPEERYPTYDVIVQPMAGFRWYETRISDVPETYSGPTLNTEVDFMVWVNPKTALDFQVSMGGTYWLTRSEPDALAFMPDLRFAAGFAF